MLSGINTSLRSWFGEKVGDDVFSRTIAALIVAAIITIVTALGTYLVLAYNIVREAIKTEGDWSNELILKLFLLLIIGIVLLTSLTFFILTKSYAKQIQTSIESIKNVVQESYSLLHLQNAKYKTNNEIATIEKTFIHTIESRQSFKHKRIIKVKALKDGISSWKDRYWWTGSKIDKFNCTNPNTKLQLDGIEEVGTGKYNSFSVNFQRHLKKGEMELIELEWVLSDPEQISEPNVGVIVLEPIDVINIQVNIFPNVGVKNMIQEETIGNYITHNKEEIDIKDKLTHTWTISKPIIGHAYFVRWNF